LAAGRTTTLLGAAPVHDSMNFWPILDRGLPFGDLGLVALCRAGGMA
jgi:hypothetical protein